MDDERIAAWNVYFPNPAVMRRDGVELLNSLDRVDLARPEFEETRRTLLEHRLVFEGPHDPYELEFYDSVAKQLAKSELSAQRIYVEEGSYGNLYFTNVACNLGCSYCISHAGDLLRPKLGWTPQLNQRKLSMAISVADQYLARRRKLGLTVAQLSFNGGEILLEWPLLREVLRFAQTKYPEMTLKCEMNSNVTRMTPELAKELSDLEIVVYTSIDGHKEHHNATRVYHKGGGSFDDVMKGIETFNAVSSHPMQGFQGTIDKVDKFSARELFRMHKHGFMEARMAPNLLKATPEEGEARANLQSDLFEMGQRRKLLFSDTYFEATEKVAKKNHDGFRFYCTGLSGLPNLLLTYNIDTAELSQLCTFVSPAAVKFDDVGGDIYSPILWDATRKYIVSRLNQLKDYCARCDVVGVCRGGCIMQGLDLENKPNPGACAFQRTMWRRYLKYAGRDESAPKRRKLRVLGGESGCGTGSSCHRQED